MQFQLGAALALLSQLYGCALPSIHRDAADREAKSPRSDAAVDAPSPAAMPLVDEDAGPRVEPVDLEDPAQDPQNRNEDEATYQALLPKEHIWAEWPMPDTSPHAKVRPSYSVDGAVVVDNITKLRWQHKMPKIYPGCEASYVFVGRDQGVGTGCTWEEARAYCSRPERAEELGAGSWRLPTKIELESLIDSSRVNSVHPLFDDFPIDRVWSSSPILNPDGLKLAWAVDFTEGTTMDSGRYKAGRVRCVSSPSETGGHAPDYQIEEDYVRDNTTQLEWHRFPDSATRDLAEAHAYCEGLSLVGGGWRLPSLKELLTLVNAPMPDPAVYRMAFAPAQSERYWTATDFLDARGAVYKVEFKGGGSGYQGTVDEAHYVRCVR